MNLFLFKGKFVTFFSSSPSIGGFEPLLFGALSPGYPELDKFKKPRLVAQERNIGFSNRI